MSFCCSMERKHSLNFNCILPRKVSELLRLCHWLRRLQFYPYMILSTKPCLGPASNYDLPLLFSIGSTITAAMETSVIQARCGSKRYLEGKDSQKSTLSALCPLLDKGLLPVFPYFHHHLLPQVRRAK